MSEKIVIDIFNLDSIEAAIDKLNGKAKELQSRADTVTRRMAELHAETAMNHYRSGFVDENDGVDVSVEKVDDGYLVTASGEDVYFLEFGTGTAAGNGYDTSVITPPVSIEPWSWSSTEGTGEGAKYGSWHHNGRKYTMTVPRMGMYFGVKEAEAQFEQIAKEVFDD